MRLQIFWQSCPRKAAGCQVSGGPDVGRRVVRWTNPQRNLPMLLA